LAILNTGAKNKDTKNKLLVSKIKGVQILRVYVF